MARKLGMSGGESARLSLVSKDSTTIAGEPLAYIATPTPEISSAIMTIVPGATTQWMTHPVPTYIYVLEGTLRVEFAEGPPRVFSAGQAFLQTRTKWHHGRNDGKGPVRFLVVSIGAREVPGIVHPPPGSANGFPRGLDGSAISCTTAHPDGRGSIRVKSAARRRGSGAARRPGGTRGSRRA